MPTAGGQELCVKPFRILEHTADIGFEAFGASPEEVFANAGRALFHIMVDLESLKAHESIKIQVEGPDLPSLLVNWLSELLYLQDAEGWLFFDFEINSLSDKSLAAVARGEKLDPARHQLKLLVKAITYHRLEVQHGSAGWRAQVYVDI